MVTKAVGQGANGQKSLCSTGPGAYTSHMQPHSGRGRKWRRFRRKYGVFVFVAVVSLVVVALVAFLTYTLTSINWRLR